MSQDIQSLLPELKRLAEAATPGLWEVNRHGAVLGGPVQRYTNGSGRNQIALATGAEWMREGEQMSNSEFIAAANPATLLALIDHIEALERQLAEAQKYAARYEFIRSQTSPVQVSIHGIDSGLAIDGLDQAIDDEMASWAQPADQNWQLREGDQFASDGRGNGN